MEENGNVEESYKKSSEQNVLTEMFTFQGKYFSTVNAKEK